jgi:HD superfamily phosphohydrolase
VHFTTIERLILNERVAQRLRSVAQSGLAQYVYPEVRTSRFSHSLGAMHLASAFFAASLKNARPDVRHRVCEAVRDVVHAARAPYVRFDVSELATLLSPEPLLAHHYAPATAEPDPGFSAYLMLAEQALRLSALFHDLGHLPFSHDFESALEEVWHGVAKTKQSKHPLRSLLRPATQTHGEKPHERLGHALARILLEHISQTLPEPGLSPAIQITFTLAQRILEADEVSYGTVLPTNRTEAVYRWLHTLVDGEVDVDRCDYILRDGRNYGFAFSAFDLDRLIDNLTVSAHNQAFLVTVTPHGVTAVESFLMARFRSYQNSVRHHKVAQVGAALRFCIRQRMQNVDDPELQPFVATLRSIMEVAGDLDQNKPPSVPPSQVLSDFAQYDDMWWMALMRRRAATADDDAWLQLVCWRRNGPQSLWKWRGNFPETPALTLRQWNAMLPRRGDTRERDWQTCVARLEKQGVLVTRHHFAPWKAMIYQDDTHSQFCVETANGDLVPLTYLSPLVRTLPAAWADDVQVQAFASENKPEGFKQEVYDKLTAALRPIGASENSEATK